MYEAEAGEPNHVWAYDFVSCRTHDGRPVRMLTMIDKFSRECLAIRAARKLNSDCVLELLTELFTLRGVPEHVRADNGPEFTAKAVRNWLPKVGGADTDRAVAERVQLDPSAQCTRIPIAGPRGHQAQAEIG